jgi:hypothetical protein
MLSNTTETCVTQAAIESYVMAAIVIAREVYTDQNWLVWADHWMAGRDRSFASARMAHRMARQARDRELAESAANCQRAGLDSKATETGPTETPAEMAAWAAGLALVTAPVAPDPSAGFRRLRFALRSRRSSPRAARNERPLCPSLAGRAVALARRVGSMLSSSQVPQAARP